MQWKYFSNFKNSKNVIPLTLILILSDGQFHSKKKLKKQLNLSYVAIGNNIDKLKKWGINIFCSSEKNYRLLQSINLLDKSFIYSQFKNNKIKILPLVDSTNQYLIDHLEKLCSGDVCIAEYQKKGRGRQNRKWISPFGVNLYFSMYWNFKKKLTIETNLSLMISIIIAELLEKLGVKKICVKWPNDLYINNRKLAGILIELIKKNDRMNTVVIGIGINLEMRNNTQSDSINQNWISLKEIGKSINRNILIIKLIKKLRSSLIQFEQEGFSPFLFRWRRLDGFTNCPIKLISRNKEIYGISRGINEKGELLLERNKTIEPWFGNEISLCSLKNKR